MKVSDHDDRTVSEQVESIAVDLQEKTFDQDKPDNEVFVQALNPKDGFDQELVDLMKINKEVK